MFLKKLLKWFPPAIGTFLLLPLLGVLFTLFIPQSEIWQHLLETRLLELLKNTLVLVVSVGIGTFILGTSLAWFVVMYRFPGRKIFEWALILPLSIPGYVLGMIYINEFEFSVTWMNIRSWYGAAGVLTLVLYPYVYLMARVAFQGTGKTVFDAARILGVKRRKLFQKVALPVSRPMIFAGVSLAIMETMADFGTVGLFTYDTFTTAIYEVWFGMFEPTAATQLASILLFFNLGIFYLEYKTRRNHQYDQQNISLAEKEGFKLTRVKGLFVFLYPFLVLLAAFIYPVYILIKWSLTGTDQFNESFMQSLGHTLLFGLSAGVVVILLSIMFAYYRKTYKAGIHRIMIKMVTSGYALPGTVIAVGIMLPLTKVDFLISQFLEESFNISTGLWLSTSMFALLFAYSVRFLTVGFKAVDSSLAKITPSMDMAAKILGAGSLGILKRVHIPMIRSGVLTGIIMVIVEVMKEMPATLILRPFGVDTLATRVWQLSSESLIEEAALPALFIVLAGIIPVIFLVRFSSQQKK